MKSQACVLGVLLVLVSMVGHALPMSVFVVHCEPTRANPIMWLELVDLVSQADQYQIPLSIYFTAQWAEMILQDEAKLETLDAWLVAGHEIGCHHHGYWGTKERGSTWDGYTNSPIDSLDPEDRGRFLGTMEAYMEILNALPGERRSGCMGGGVAADVIDHPCQLEYSTQGHSLDDVAVVPSAVPRNLCVIKEIGHGLILGQQRGALQDLYLSSTDEIVFGANGHVYNYADFPMVFIEWFRFLHEMDESGTFRGTVSSVLDAWESED